MGWFKYLIIEFVRSLEPHQCEHEWNLEYNATFYDYNKDKCIKEFCIKLEK